MENIYHCCIQKSASQWLRAIFSDSLVRRYSGLAPFIPEKDYILAARNRGELEKGFPEKTIVTPLYVDYHSFCVIPKPQNWRALWVMRDPRDMIVSRYYSHRESHAMLNPSLEEERRALQRMSFHDGLMRMILDLGKRASALLEALSSWLEAEQEERVRLFRYEDLTGPHQEEEFTRMLDHCEISLGSGKLKRLLKSNSFQRLSGGRKRGEESTQSHYRRGVAGDWQSHFSPEHEEAFREVSGDLLQRLGYPERARR